MDSTELRNSLIALHSASFAWAMLCCRDRELAEEVLQSVYVKVLSGRAPFRGQAAFRTWLFTVIRNAARDQRRPSWWTRVLRGNHQALETLTAPATAGQLENQDLVAAVRAALERLPERQRQVAHLVFYQDLTVAEAAEVMGVALGTARQHYARAKDTLNSLLSTNPTQNETNPSVLR